MRRRCVQRWMRRWPDDGEGGVCIGALLAPFNDVTYRSEAEARAHRTRLLFPVSQPTLAPQE